MSAAPAVSQEGPLAMICGGGSLPLAVARLVAARGREVVLFPLRGAAEPADFARRPHHWLYLGQDRQIRRGSRAPPAAATWSSSDRWCGRRFGRCAPI